MLLSFAGEALGSLLAFLWERRLCFGYREGPLGSVWLLPLASEILSDVLGNSPGLTGEPFSGTEWSPTQLESFIRGTGLKYCGTWREEVWDLN